MAVAQFGQTSTFNLKTVKYRVEDLAAGADISGRCVFTPQEAIRVQAVRYVGPAASAGIDGSNTLVLTLKQGSTTIATATRITNTTANVSAGLTVSANTVAAGVDLLLDVTQGATADMPSFDVEITYNHDGLDT